MGDIFGRTDYKIIGLIKAGQIKSELALEDEEGIIWMEQFDNHWISNLNKYDIITSRYVCKKYDGKSKITKLFNEDFTLKRELFGTVNVKILEMDKGYKSNTVFYGICKDDYGNNTVVKYGLSDRKKKDLVIGETIEINSLELTESKAYHKNKKLLEMYGA